MRIACGQAGRACMIRDIYPTTQLEDCALGCLTFNDIPLRRVQRHVIVYGMGTNAILNSECFCSNSLNALSAKLADTDCALPCAGNSSIVCGGPLRLSVYQVKTQAQIDADKKKAAGFKTVPQASLLALSVALGMVFW